MREEYNIKELGPKKNPKEQMIEFLGIDEKTLEKNIKRLPKICAWYARNPNENGFSIIINRWGEKLIATSDMKFEELLKRFNSGERN